MVLDWIEHVTAGRDEEFAEILWRHASEAGDLGAGGALRDAGRLSAPPGVRRRRGDPLVRPRPRGARSSRGGARVRSSDSRRCSLAARRTSSSGDSRQPGRTSSGPGRSPSCVRPAAASGSRGGPWRRSSRSPGARADLDDAEALLPEALAAAMDQGADDLIARLVGRRRIGRPAPRRPGRRHRATTSGPWPSRLEAEDREGEASPGSGWAEAALVVGPFPAGLDQARQADARFRRAWTAPARHRSERLIAMLLWATGQPDEAIESARTAVTGARAVASRARPRRRPCDPRVRVELSGRPRPRDPIDRRGGGAGRATRDRRPDDRDVCLACHRRGRAGRSSRGSPTRSGWRSLAPTATNERIHRGPLLAARGWIELADDDRVARGHTFDEAVRAGRRLPSSGLPGGATDAPRRHLRRLGRG